MSLSAYEETCTTLGVKIEPSVWSAIHCKSRDLVLTTRSPQEPSLLAVVKHFSKHPCPEVVHLGGRHMRAAFGDGNWLVQCLAVSMRTELLRILDLHGLGIDGRGLRELAGHASRFPVLKALGLKYNHIGCFAGDKHLVQFVQRVPVGSDFEFLDISCNGLSFAAIRSITNACGVRAGGHVRVHAQPSDELHIDHFASGHFEAKPTKGVGVGAGIDIVVEGNFPAEEIWNSGLHGVGVLLAIWGLWDLLESAGEFMENSLRLAVVVYGLSAILLFSASTLYHSFFAFSLTKQIFQIADHCSVFVLIAGSYTPICAHLAVVRGIPAGWLVLKAEWSMCLAGILLHTLSLHWPRWARSLQYMTLELCIYSAMGWLVVVMWEPVALHLDPQARNLLMLGGLLYMAGVGFFVWDSVKVVPALHAVWHFFVLAAAISHYFAIRSIVQSF